MVLKDESVAGWLLPAGTAAGKLGCQLCSAAAAAAAAASRICIRGASGLRVCASAWRPPPVLFIQPVSTTGATATAAGLRGGATASTACSILGIAHAAIAHAAGTRAAVCSVSYVYLLRVTGCAPVARLLWGMRDMMRAGAHARPTRQRVSGISASSSVPSPPVACLCLVPSACL
jgi:hypothetical protein